MANVFHLLRSDAAKLAAADVVLTTYSTIESDFRKTRAPTKARVTD